MQFLFAGLLSCLEAAGDVFGDLFVGIWHVVTGFGTLLEGNKPTQKILELVHDPRTSSRASYF